MIMTVTAKRISRCGVRLTECGISYEVQTVNTRRFSFGSPGDIPTPGDYDGDGRIEYSVWRTGGANGPGTFYKYSLWQGFGAIQWGNESMKYPQHFADAISTVFSAMHQLFWYFARLRHV